MKCFQKLFMCFVCLSLCYGYSLAFRTEGISFSRKICSHASLLRKIAPLSLNDCQKTCKLRDNCTSISYNRRFKVCELHSTTNSDPVVLIAAKGWVYMGKDDTDADIGECANNNCLPNDTCTENVDTTSTCKHDDCGFIQPDEINGDMYDTGSRKAISCIDGYWKNVSSLATCNATGNCNTSGECERGICSHPEFDGTVVLKEAYLKKAQDFMYVNGSIANISDLVFTNGSQLHFTCTDDLYMYRSPIKHCFNETWSSVPQCFALRLGKSCSDAKDCDVPEIPHSSGMNCTKQICDCPFGYGYSYSEFRCFERCPNDDFANTFRKTKGVVLQGFNELIVPTLNKDICIQRCIDETGFTCRSFDHVLSSCRLQSVVVADEPDSILYYLGSYYQRDCL